MNLKHKTETMFTKQWMTYVMLFFAAVIYVFGIETFLNEAGTFSAGLGAFAQLLTYTVDGLERYFGILYLAFNIPFLIFFWNKIKKRFLIKTIFFLLVQLGLSSLYMIPEVESTLTNLFSLTPAQLASPWAIILIAFVGSFLVAFGITIAWKYGGSTGGTDYVGYYYSTKKQKSVGSILFIISSSILTFAIIVNLIINKSTTYTVGDNASASIASIAGADAPVTTTVREHWLASIVASVMYIAIMSLTMNTLYPKYSKVRLEIHSNHSSDIIKFLKETNYVHAYNLTDETSGFVGNKKVVITSVVLLLEVKGIVRALHKVDPEVWISETRVRRVFGAFTTTNVD